VSKKPPGEEIKQPKTKEETSKLAAEILRAGTPDPPKKDDEHQVPPAGGTWRVVKLTLGFEGGQMDRHEPEQEARATEAIKSPDAPWNLAAHTSTYPTEQEARAESEALIAQNKLHMLLGPGAPAVGHFTLPTFHKELLEGLLRGEYDEVIDASPVDLYTYVGFVSPELKDVYVGGVDPLHREAQRREALNRLGWGPDPFNANDERATHGSGQEDIPRIAPIRVKKPKPNTPERANLTDRADKYGTHKRR